MSRGLPAPAVTGGTRPVNRGRLDSTGSPRRTKEDGSTVIEMREPAAPDAPPEPNQAADRGVRISVWQDFDDWQFELDRDRAAPRADVEWEPFA